jgi:branched-chain amino acid transport system ATP-binding protein
MIFVEHHMDLVRAIADRVFAFEVGRLRLSGRPGDILDSGEFIDSITGMNVPM